MDIVVVVNAAVVDVVCGGGGGGRVGEEDVGGSFVSPLVLRPWCRCLYWRADGTDERI